MSFDFFTGAFFDYQSIFFFLVAELENFRTGESGIGRKAGRDRDARTGIVGENSSGFGRYCSGSARHEAFEQKREC